MLGELRYLMTVLVLFLLLITPLSVKLRHKRPKLFVYRNKWSIHSWTLIRSIVMVVIFIVRFVLDKGDDNTKSNTTSLTKKVKKVV